MAAEGRLAALPEQRPLLRVGGGADLPGAVLAADAVERGEVLVDLRGDAVELDDQDRPGVLRVAGVDRGLGGLDRQPVHDLHRGGQDPRGDDGGHGRAGMVGRVEGRELRDDRLRPPQEPERDLGRDPERPLRADEHAEQVGAGRLEARAAEPDELAVREHDGRGR